MPYHLTQPSYLYQTMLTLKWFNKQVQRLTDCTIYANLQVTNLEILHKKRVTGDGCFATEENDSNQFRMKFDSTRFDFSRYYFARHDATVEVFEVQTYYKTVINHESRCSNSRQGAGKCQTETVSKRIDSFHRPYL